ncbi:MAG: arsenate reductase ArsC [Candidatus Binatia bacterium]
MRRESIQRNILFLCDDNAYLSQIAEATARYLAPPRTRIFSAGIKPGVISLRVVEAMQELGISMRGQKTKSLDEVPMDEIDLVVSFGEAHKKCLNLPGRVKIEDWNFSSPAGSSAESDPPLDAIREDRDEIDKRVFALFLDHWRNVC